MNRFVSLLFLIGLVGHSAAEDNGSSRLNIAIPHSMYKEGGYRHREAMFGMPKYGGAYSQNVYYADADLCSFDVDNRRGYPARKRAADGKMEPWPSPFILMVDKGGCSFVTKVRNAQHAGAAGVLIANTHCLCRDKDCHSSQGGYCDHEEPSMADDGSGSDISIPAFLVFKQDADKIKDMLRQNVHVLVEMAWRLPTYGDTVSFDLWNVPTDVISRDFFQNFEKAAELLLSQGGLEFTPHIYLLNKSGRGCQSNTNGERWCETGCTNNGRYCALDPDHDVTRGISGANVVEEGLRRICIWNEYKDRPNRGMEWWRYMSVFTRNCETPSQFTNPDCIARSFREAGIQKDLIDNCMKNSGGTTADAENVILEAQFKSSAEIIVFPTTKINGAELRGRLSVSGVFSAICNAFDSESKPAVCQQCEQCGDVDVCIELDGYCPTGPVVIDTTKSGGVSGGTFVLSLLFVVGLFTGAGYYYYKKTRSDMRDRVRDILAEYMPLEDQEAPGGSSAMDFARPSEGTE